MRKGNKERQDKNFDKHHRCQCLIVQDQEQMLVYIRGAENPGCDSYGGGWLVGDARWSRITCDPALFQLFEF